MKGNQNHHQMFRFDFYVLVNAFKTERRKRLIAHRCPANRLTRFRGGDRAAQPPPPTLARDPLITAKKSGNPFLKSDPTWRAWLLSEDGEGKGRRGRDGEGKKERELGNGPFRISITLARAVHVCTVCQGAARRTGQVSFFALFNSR